MNDSLMCTNITLQKKLINDSSQIISNNFINLLAYSNKPSFNIYPICNQLLLYPNRKYSLLNMFYYYRRLMLRRQGCIHACRFEVALQGRALSLNSRACCLNKSRRLTIALVTTLTFETFQLLL